MYFVGDIFESGSGATFEIRSLSKRASILLRSLKVLEWRST